MSADAFLDTNIIVYFSADEGAKTKHSTSLILAGGIVSVQVLNEFANVARKKQRLSWPEIETVIMAVKTCCEVVPVTLETHELGVTLARRHNFSVYDAMIVAAAQLAGCRTLYSEDMRDGHAVGGLRIENPYL
jgi:predicted nucleic acid-binding protein